MEKINEALIKESFKELCSALELMLNVHPPIKSVNNPFCYEVGLEAEEVLAKAKKLL